MKGKKQEDDEVIELEDGEQNMDDDVPEDYQVADLSSIAAPVIEFMMPNLTELNPIVSADEEEEEEEEAENEKKKKKKNEKKAKKTPEKLENNEAVSMSMLTAEKLNNEIVKMRATIVKAKSRLISKLVRRKKDFEGKIKKCQDAKRSEQFQRSANRLGEEIDNMKKVERDVVSKFAILNQKSIDELLKNSGEAVVTDRLLYKLACNELVIKHVEELRKKYNNFNKTAAFFLQRLGKQYAEGKKTLKSKIEEEEQEDSEESESEEIENVEMVNSDEEEEVKAVENRRKLLLGDIKEGKGTKRKLEKKEEKEETFQTPFIKKISLAAGGKIEKNLKKGETTEKKQKVDKKNEEVEKEEEEEETGFFLPKKIDAEKPEEKPAKKLAEKVLKKEKGKSKKTNMKGEMHPSWAASQQKKKEMQSAKPCGKKIRFDDD